MIFIMPQFLGGETMAVINVVIPAKAGIQSTIVWIPIVMGMTDTDAEMNSA